MPMAEHGGDPEHSPVHALESLSQYLWDLSQNGLTGGGARNSLLVSWLSTVHFPESVRAWQSTSCRSGGSCYSELRNQEVRRDSEIHIIGIIGAV